MRRRRGNGEGSIYQDQKGRWCAVLTTGYDENGRRKRRYLRKRTKAEVLEELATTRTASLSGALAEPSRVTVSEFADRWLETAAQRIRPTTSATYRILIKRHIVPYLGGGRLNHVSPIHVQEWLGSLSRAGVSARQRESAFVLFKTMLSHAVKLGLAVRNPLDAIDKPRVAQKEIPVLTPEEVRRLLATAKGHPLEALFSMACGTGARQGELFGLQWRDLDLDAGMLSIQRTLVEIRGKISLGEPKTTKSRRQLDLPAYSVRALREHRARQLATPHPTMLVFMDSEGNPLRRSNFTRRSWHPLLEKAGLPRVKFHSLRHSHVTTLLAAGASLKAVSERVGHSKTSMTADIYAHAVEGMQRELAEKLDRLFG